jgi:cobalt-zinc-cadmium resistance protein CzcA
VLLPLVFLSISSIAMGQDGRLEQIQKDALNQHEEVRNERMLLEAAKARLKAEWGLGNTDVNLQYGQINSAQRGDYYVDVQQEIVNPWSTIERRKALALQMTTQERKLQMKEREVVRDVRTAYYDWMANVEKGRVLKQFDALFRDFRDKAELRYQLGEIDQLELGSLLGMQAQIQKQQRQQLRSEQEARKRLEDMIRRPLDADVDGELANLDNLPSSDASLAAVFNALADEEKEAVLAVRKAEQAAYWPQLSVGYFNQQIDGRPGLDGVVAGVSLPLFRSDQRTRAKESKIAVEQTDNRVTARLYQLNTALEVERAYAELAFAQWKEHGNALEEQANRMMRQALQSYEVGELDYLRFVQLMHTAMELKWNQIDLLLDAHIAQEKLNYYIK